MQAILQLFRGYNVLLRTVQATKKIYDCRSRAFAILRCIAKTEKCFY